MIKAWQWVSVQRGGWVLSSVVISVFGPYLHGGVRTEQLVVYGFAVPSALVFLKRGAPARLLPLLFAWSAFAIIAILGTLVPPSLSGAPWRLGSALAGLDNVFLPLAVMLVTAAVVDETWNARRLLRLVSGCLVGCMSVNAVAAVLQSRGADWSAWWSADSATTVTAVLAESNGRYSGLINQPVEAGFLYALAVLAAFHLWSDKPGRLTGALAIIIVGGVLTVSKTFLLVGLPMLLLELLLPDKSVWRRIQITGGSLAAAAIVFGGYLAGHWPGAKQLTFLTNPAGGQGLLSILSANRYGNGGSAGNLSTEILAEQPIFGFGLGGVDAPLDSAYVAMLAYAGLIGLLVLLAVTVYSANCWLQAAPSSARHYFGLFLLLLLASNVGISTLTANRMSTVAWLFLALFVIAAEPRIASQHSGRYEGDENAADGDPTTAKRTDVYKPRMP